MEKRFIATVVVSAALTSALTMGVVQWSLGSTAQAATQQSTTPPTDTQLLTEIAANTDTANNKLHVLGEDLESLLSEEKKIYSDTDLSAKRLRYVNTNVARLYSQFKSEFTYRNPYNTKYTTNELTLLESTLCSIEFWTQDDATGSGKPQLPPCGK